MSPTFLLYNILIIYKIKIISIDKCDVKISFWRFSVSYLFFLDKCFYFFDWLAYYGRSFFSDNFSWCFLDNFFSYSFFDWSFSDNCSWFSYYSYHWFSNFFTKIFWIVECEDWYENDFDKSKSKSIRSMFSEIFCNFEIVDNHQNHKYWWE